MRINRLFLPIALVLASATILAGCRGGGAPTPTPTPTPAINAAAIFQQRCSPCHGTNREGVVGPSLIAAALQARGRSDEYIRETITNGRGGMTAWKGTLSSAEIEALIRFLRS